MKKFEGRVDSTLIRYYCQMHMEEDNEVQDIWDTGRAERAATSAILLAVPLLATALLILGAVFSRCS